MQSAQRPPITVTLVGLRQPLSPPLPKKIVGREPDEGRSRWIIKVKDKTTPMYNDFYQHRLHTNSGQGRGGAYLSHEFSATLQFLNPLAMYILKSVENVAEVCLTVNDEIFNERPILDLQEENSANQGLLLFQGADGYDFDHPEKYKNLSWLPNLVVVKHHQFYMPKQEASAYQESYMERILNGLYLDSQNGDNRLFCESVSYVQLLNKVLPEWQSPNYAAYRETLSLFQQALNHLVPDSFYPDKADDYGSDYVIFPRSQTLILSPELVIHRVDMIDEIKATLFLQHQIVLFIYKTLNELTDDESIPRGILMDLQLFEKELFAEETLKNINQPSNKKDLIFLANKIASHLDGKRIALTRHFDALLVQRSQVLFNHLKIVMQQNVSIATQIMNYQMLEQEFNAGSKKPKKNNNQPYVSEWFSQFEREFNSIINSPDTEMPVLVSFIQRMEKRQKKRTIIRAIFNNMFSCFEAISNLLHQDVGDIGGNADAQQYNAIAGLFSNFSQLYLKICFLSAIVQVPRWLKNIRLQYGAEKIQDGEGFEGDLQLCQKIEFIAFSVVYEVGNFNCRLFSRQLAEIFPAIGVQQNIFFELVAYMADYLYAECGENITISIMRHFVEISYIFILENNASEAINRFFLAKLVDPVNNNTTYDSLVRLTKKQSDSCQDIFSLLEVFISENFREFNPRSFPDELGGLVQFCHGSVLSYARDDSNTQNRAEKIQLAEKWAKDIITTKESSDDIPYLLKVLVVQAILFAYQKKGELREEGIFTLAISYLAQKPKNFYMACQMFNYLFDSSRGLYRNLEEESVEKVIEVLDRCEIEGFISQRVSLRKIDEVFSEKLVEDKRRSVVSKRLLIQLSQYLSMSGQERSAPTLRSPVNCQPSKKADDYNPNIFSLKRISQNNGLEVIAIPVLEILQQRLGNQLSLFEYIRSSAGDIFPALYGELEDGANVWCLYAIVIAYLVKKQQSLEAEKVLNNTCYNVCNIPVDWGDFFDGRSKDNSALSLRALLALEASYKQLEETHGVSPVGQQAIAMLIKTMIPAAFFEEHIVLLCMVNHVTQADESWMMNFLHKYRNQSIPFAIKADKVGCFVIDKSTNFLFTMFGTNFNTFLRLVRGCGAVSNFSILVLLVKSQDSSLSIDRFEMVGEEAPDLFDFAWYLKYNKNQPMLAAAIMASCAQSNNNPNLTEILNTLNQDISNQTLLDQAAEELRQMIEKEPVELINKSPEHLRLAFILYHNEWKFQGCHEKTFRYFILQSSERLVALFFMNELIRQLPDHRILFRHFCMLFFHERLTLLPAWQSLAGIKNPSDDLDHIKVEIGGIVTTDVNQQISSAIRYFNQSTLFADEIADGYNDVLVSGYEHK